MGEGDKGIPPLISVTELLALVEYAAERGAWISNLEAYQLTDGSEIPAIELSIYGVPSEAEALPKDEKIAFMKNEIQIILGYAKKEPDPYGFVAWVDYESE